MGVAERRQREKLERQEAILAAAEKVFQAKGPALATMDEIAMAAEVSKGTLYLYFSSKDQLHGELMSRKLSTARGRMEGRVSDSQTGLEMIRELLAGLAEFANNNPELFIMATTWLLQRDSDVRGEAYDSYRQQVRQLNRLHVTAIERGIRDGSIRDDLHPPRIALQLFGAVRGILLIDVAPEPIAQRIPEAAHMVPMTPSFIDFLIEALRPEGHAQGAS